MDRRLSFAKSMRSNPTDAERAVWAMLQAGRLDGLKFKRQVPIGPYIVDFLCEAHGLIVEVDGSQHADSTTDGVLDAYFTRSGYRMLRIWNNEALQNRDGVARAILAATERR